MRRGWGREGGKPPGKRLKKRSRSSWEQLNLMASPPVMKPTNNLAQLQPSSLTNKPSKGSACPRCNASRSQPRPPATAVPQPIQQAPEQPHPPTHLITNRTWTIRRSFVTWRAGGGCTTSRRLSCRPDRAISTTLTWPPTRPTSGLIVRLKSAMRPLPNLKRCKRRISMSETHLLRSKKWWELCVVSDRTRRKWNS